MDWSRLSTRGFAVVRNAAFPGLLCAVAACTAGESAAPTAPAASNAAAAPLPPQPASASDGLAALVQASRVKCTDAKNAKGCSAGNIDTGDFYDVELLPGCGSNGFFAGVAQAKGVDALKTVPSTGSSVVTNATLAQGQLVCVQGIARAGQNPSYYYVVAIPAHSVAMCKNNALCDQYGDRPIKRTKPDSAETCHAATPGHYLGDCAQGWVSADALEVFSNGM